MQLFIVRLRKKGQITLPADIRRKLDLKEDDELILTLKDDVIILRPMRTRVPLRYLRPSDDEIEYAIIDPVFIPHYYEEKYHGKKHEGDTHR